MVSPESRFLNFVVVNTNQAHTDQIYLLADAKCSPLPVKRLNSLDLSLKVPNSAPDPVDSVVVVECEFPRDRELHARYHIEAAPLTVVADGRGVVHATLVGAYDATELWTTVAEARAAAGERQEP